MLLVVTFLTLNQDEFIPTFHYLSWIIFVYVSGVLPFAFMKRSWQTVWFYAHFVILIGFGVLVWEFSFVNLLILLTLPFWRMVHLLETPAKPAFIYQRFIWFAGLLLSCYFMISTMSSGNLNSTFIPLLWIQFGLLIVGVMSINYINAYQGTGSTLKSWLKSQSFIIYLILGFGVLASIGTFLLPVLRFIVFGVPEAIYQFLVSDRLSALFSWIYIEELQIENGSTESKSTTVREEWQLLDDVLEQNTIIPEWVNQALLILVQVGVVLGIIFLLYYIIRNFYFVPSLQGRKKVEDQRFTTQAQGKRSSRSWFKRTEWARDEVRRLYQSLLLHAQKKGKELKSSQTTREWSAPFIVEKEHPELWSKINRLYEQKRYSPIPLKEDDISQFKEEIDRAKKEIDLYYQRQREQQKKES
jgi:uncharacterized protein (DUF2132 family)